MELEAAHSAARHAGGMMQRDAQAPPLAELPSQKDQNKHFLTHVPYEPWCSSCVAFRARADRHMRDDSTHARAVPTISFDFCYTKSVPEGKQPQDVKSLVCLVMVCSQTGYIHCTPIKHKNQFDLMARELITFSQLLGHTDLTFMADNEPTMRQLMRMAVNRRLAMGLPTRSTTPPAYSHGNSLVENAIGRVRPLAGSFTHALGEKLGIEISTSSHMWTRAMRHAAWVINRSNVTAGRGVTSFQLLSGKQYNGKICQFGEPVFGFQKSQSKGNPRWKRMVFLGKIDPQDSYLLYNGTHLILARSVRRINTCWKGHVAFYLNFNCASYEYRSSFGGRVVPTKSRQAPIAPGFNPPVGDVEPSKFFDEDAEAVRQKALEEQREDYESANVAIHDKQNPMQEMEQQPQVGLEDANVIQHPNPIGIFDDPAEGGDNQPQEVANPALGLPGPSTPPSFFEVPMTPPVIAPSSSAAGSTDVPVTPRTHPTTRAHGEEEKADEQIHKKAKMEDSKKPRLMQLSEQHSAMIRAVQFDDGSEFHTMDDYSQDLKMTDHEEDEAHWQNDPSVFSGVPLQLWSDADISVKPEEPPQWLDDLAEETKLARLTNMGVIQREADHDGVAEKSHQLNTKFVRDWRLKQFGDEADGEPTFKWLRRSRLVAREYAFLEKRQDVYSPASSTHVLNLLPLLWLQRCSDLDDVAGGVSCSDQVMASLDIKDAFLEVPQHTPLSIKFAGQTWVVLKNLPGQRLGARAWYWYLRTFLDETMKFEFCSVQPCLARTPQCAILIHVDDIMYVGSLKFWNEFKEKLQQRFSISCSVLEGVGTEISFLKRRLLRVEDGLALLPGSSIGKLIKV